MVAVKLAGRMAQDVCENWVLQIGGIQVEGRIVAMEGSPTCMVLE